MASFVTARLLQSVAVPAQRTTIGDLAAISPNDEGAGMEWTTTLPSGATYAGRIDESFKDDDVAFVLDFTRLAMKARLGYFQSSRPEDSMKLIKKMAGPSKNRSLAEIVALEHLAAAAIAWKNSEGDAQFDVLYRAVEEYEFRERGKSPVPARKRSRGRDSPK
jgi:hypothetical protein